MGVRNDIIGLLKRTKKELKKFETNLARSVNTGRFYRFTLGKRNSLVRKLNRLQKRVAGLSWQVKTAAIGGTLIISPLDKVSAQSNVGPFNLQTRANNPLRHPIRGDQLRPSAVDFDNDGDYDVALGNSYSYLQILQNEGTNTNPKFTDHYVLDESLDKIRQNSRPTFADIDGDGHMELIMGDGYSFDRIRYFKSNAASGGVLGSTTNPLFFTEETAPWDPIAKTGNPFNSINTRGNTLNFVDFDADGDLDVFIGHAYYSSGIYYMSNVHYFANNVNNEPDKDGVFTLSTLQFTSIFGYGSSDYVAPTIADIDEDGNLDLVAGIRNGNIRFFKGDGGMLESSFTEQTGTWDPIAKTGNPFNTISFDNFSHPTFADLDNDGDLDMVVGQQRGTTYKYLSSDDPLLYFENTGNAVFEERTGFDNPFAGIDVGLNASLSFVRFEEEADLDIVIGSKYDYNYFEDFEQRIRFYKNEDGIPVEKMGAENPLNDILPFIDDPIVQPYLVNLDADADLEIVVDTYFDGFLFFDKVDGAYVQLIGEDNPFDALSGSLPNRTKVTFGDIDGDGKSDLLIGIDNGSASLLRYFKNVSEGETVGDIAFEEKTGTENPFDESVFDYHPLPLLIDIDNDGDLDLILPERYGVYDYYLGIDDPPKIHFYENTGSPADPVFTKRDSHPFSNLEISTYSQFAFNDFDKDGDLDLFAGNRDGQIDFFLNDNPAPVTSVGTSIVNYTFGDAFIIVDANLTISDTDNDLISRATISIQNFQVGNESLNFTAQAPITGNFDTATGILTLQGNASLSAYQSVLRTVTYSYNGPDPGARKGNSGRVKSLTRTISFEVLDEDRTAPIIASRTISVASQANSAPVITVSNLSTVINNLVTIDLNTIISDPDGNLDPLTFAVIPNEAPTPPRVGNATITNSILTIDYAGTDFAGTDFVTIEACDTEGLCATAEITIQVDGDIIVRNGISPNGDGLNDFFRLDNITTLGPENKVLIYNRWGDKVFEMTNYDNTTRRFEGVSDDGKDLGSGVYFYKIEFSNGLPSLEGYLTLKR